MAVTRSGLFASQWINALMGIHVVNLNLETHKMALFTNLVTPDFSASASLARYGAGAFASDEVVGSGYTAGGKLVTGTTVVEASASRIAFRFSALSWTSSSIANARCGLLYAPYITTPNANPALALFDFEEDKSSTGGVFTFTPPTNAFVWNQIPA